MGYKRGDDVRFLEPHALLEQLVEMGCVGVWMRRPTPGCLIVRQDEHHIGFEPGTRNQRAEYHSKYSRKRTVHCDAAMLRRVGKGELRSERGAPPPCLGRGQQFRDQDAAGQAHGRTTGVISSLKVSMPRACRSVACTSATLTALPGSLLTPSGSAGT